MYLTAAAHVTKMTSPNALQLLLLLRILMEMYPAQIQGKHSQGQHSHLTSPPRHLACKSTNARKCSTWFGSVGIVIVHISSLHPRKQGMSYGFSQTTSPIPLTNSPLHDQQPDGTTEDQGSTPALPYSNQRRNDQASIVRSHFSKCDLVYRSNVALQIGRAHV